MTLPDALGKQFQPFFIFSSQVRMLSACHPAAYAPEENVKSTCWIEGLYSGHSIVQRFDTRTNWNSNKKFGSRTVSAALHSIVRLMPPWVNKSERG
jgi:hypothetical protein